MSIVKLDIGSSSNQDVSILSERINALIQWKRKELEKVMTPEAPPDEFEQRSRMQLELMITLNEIEMRNKLVRWELELGSLEKLYKNLEDTWSAKYSRNFSALWDNWIREYDELLTALLVITENTETLH